MELVTSFRRRQREFDKFVLSSEYVVYCTDADGLFGALGHIHKTEGWRLFIDLLKVSLKATYILLFQ